VVLDLAMMMAREGLPGIIVARGQQNQHPSLAVWVKGGVVVGGCKCNTPRAPPAAQGTSMRFA
jgi:hypothetical protein